MLQIAGLKRERSAEANNSIQWKQTEVPASALTIPQPRGYATQVRVNQHQRNLLDFRANQLLDSENSNIMFKI
jgi:hypothetical protein